MGALTTSAGALVIVFVACEVFRDLINPGERRRLSVWIGRRLFASWFDQNAARPAYVDGTAATDGCAVSDPSASTRNTAIAPSAPTRT
jgi:hypothetical protein